MSSRDFPMHRRVEAFYSVVKNIWGFLEKLEDWL